MCVWGGDVGRRQLHMGKQFNVKLQAIKLEDDERASHTKALKSLKY